MEKGENVAVVAVGGNSLIKDSSHEALPYQEGAAAESMHHVADMIRQGWEVVITHGNGPQVGYLLRRSELARHELHEISLDYCGADTQGATGYMFKKALYNDFLERDVDKKVVAIVTQTVVDRDDPAFGAPSKPIGSFMDEEMARLRAEQENWAVVEEPGRGWRRVVPSPQPVRIVEAAVIRSLTQEGFVVVGAGGGGIPVVEDEDGRLVGVEAVIDKDHSSALLANTIGAGLFLISTAVEQVALNFGQPDERWLDRLTLDEAKEYQAEGHFGKGSMGPKIEAAISFLERGGERALITNPENITRALNGESGTLIAR
ncbi:MAG: carbamate kinase [Rubrobacteraceae bacterium]